MTGEKKDHKKDTCGCRMNDGTICGRDLYDNKYCIFHSENKDRKKKDFKPKFDEELGMQMVKKKYYDFTGFVFPENFENISIFKKFDKDVYFVGTKFSGKADFRNARFKEDAQFERVQFKSEADFSGAKFIRYAIFSGVEFHKSADFKGAIFRKAIFIGAQFSKMADFMEVQFFGVTNFPHAKFKREAVFKNTRFYEEVDFLREPQITVEVNFVKAEFSMKADFENSKFTTASFRGTQFSGVAIFAMAEFSKEANFNEAKFSGGTAFWHARFLKHTNTYFTRTEFYVYSNFREAQFDGDVHFINAEFHGNVTFNSFSYCGKVNFREVKFYKEAEFRRPNANADVNNLSFDYTYFFNVVGLFEFIEENDKVFKKLRKRSKTLKTEFLPKNFKLILGEATTARYPVQSRQIKDDMYLLDKKERISKLGPWRRRFGFKNILFFLWWLFANYGRSFKRWAAWSFGFAIAFAFIYYFSYSDYMLNFQTVYVSEGFRFFSFIYYSIVTFTTLGFGDIVPRTGWLQFWVMLEVILGYIMLGGLISILANKLARRS